MEIDIVKRRWAKEKAREESGESAPRSAVVKGELIPSEELLPTDLEDELGIASWFNRQLTEVSPLSVGELKPISLSKFEDFIRATITHAAKVAGKKIELQAIPLTHKDAPVRYGNEPMEKVYERTYLLGEVPVFTLVIEPGEEADFGTIVGHAEWSSSTGKAIQDFLAAQ